MARQVLPVDEGDFRAALGHFASGVVVLTGMHDGGPAGLTCQSFFSLSLAPPLVAFAPSMVSTSWPRVRSTGFICANVLAADQEGTARAFASSGADKFAGVGWTPGTNGAPRLHGSLAWIDCAIDEEHPAGDHHLVVARVESLETGSGKPLLFYRGGFGGFEA